MFDLFRLVPTFFASEPVAEAAHGAAEHAAEGGHGGGHHDLTFIGLMIFVALVLVILFGLMSAGKKGLNNRFFTNKITQWFEQLYLFIENMAVGIIGDHGRKYIPMIMTFWMVIFISNLLALLLPSAPTADLGFNLGMALISIGYVQWEGMKSNGVFGHFKHFAGPKLPLAMIVITGMIFVIELISEAMKNVSLSLRLFGNINGGHQAVEAMNTLGANIFGSGFDIPIGAVLFPIKLLTCVVQALIFCLLTCVYISLVTHHEEEHHEEGGHAPAMAH